jgi:hypothetical protein
LGSIHLKEVRRTDKTPAMKGVIAATGGVLVELGALLVAFVAAGAGHGTYVPAKLLFPYPLALTAITHSINGLLIALALLQFPAYALVAVANRNRHWVPGALMALHVLAVVAAFLFADRSFTP